MLIQDDSNRSYNSVNKEEEEKEEGIELISRNGFSRLIVRRARCLG
jgi:hypothetical protein